MNSGVLPTEIAVWVGHSVEMLLRVRPLRRWHGRRYVRAAAESVADGVGSRIRMLLAEFLDMPTSMIMDRVGWTRDKTAFFERLARMRRLFPPSDPASRTEYQRGDLAHRAYRVRIATDFIGLHVARRSD